MSIRIVLFFFGLLCLTMPARSQTAIAEDGGSILLYSTTTQEAIRLRPAPDDHSGRSRARLEVCRILNKTPGTGDGRPTRLRLSRCWPVSQAEYLPHSLLESLPSQFPQMLRQEFEQSRSFWGYVVGPFVMALLNRVVAEYTYQRFVAAGVKQWLRLTAVFPLVASYGYIYETAKGLVVYSGLSGKSNSAVSTNHLETFLSGEHLSLAGGEESARSLMATVIETLCKVAERESQAQGENHVS